MTTWSDSDDDSTKEECKNKWSTCASYFYKIMKMG